MGQRFWVRLVAWVAGNIAFYLIQQRFGWFLAFAVAVLAGSARLLGWADPQKAMEDERRGLSK
jgi:hypothetical protein